MASNSFGKIFKITTWGESHGKAIGVVIDGCPAGLQLQEEELHAALFARAPGNSPHTSPRKESDQPEILSGLFEGKTTGAPISILIPNQDADSSKYAPIKEMLRPGHANFTYLQKWGIFDWRGGGRASGRETACRVAAGYIAKKLLGVYGIELSAYLKQVGGVDTQDQEACLALLEKVKSSGDSVGGIVEFVALNVPVGLGNPIYAKLEAELASAMLSLPAAKGFEIGSGFEAGAMLGSLHNDLFVKDQEKIKTSKNDAGGVLGGISTGMPIIGRVAFKPPSSIKIPQETLTLEGEKTTLKLPEGSRHDPCVAIRATPVVEAMTALVLIDAMLLMRCDKLYYDL